MAYNWLAHHLVPRRFPDLDKKMQHELISEAVCRAWCACQAPDYRLMQACVTAAARRKEPSLSPAVPAAKERPQELEAAAGELSFRAVVVHMADYRSG